MKKIGLTKRKNIMNKQSCHKGKLKRQRARNQRTWFVITTGLSL
jgi:hypothetical protein